MGQALGDALGLSHPSVLPGRLQVCVTIIAMSVWVRTCLTRTVNTGQAGFPPPDAGTPTPGSLSDITAPQEAAIADPCPEARSWTFTAFAFLPGRGENSLRWGLDGGLGDVSVCLQPLVPAQEVVSEVTLEFTLVASVLLTARA